MKESSNTLDVTVSETPPIVRKVAELKRKSAQVFDHVCQKQNVIDFQKELDIREITRLLGVLPSEELYYVSLIIQDYVSSREGDSL